MGILRTDKISGLETPTAVTGSVNFPGSDDYITAPANTPELLLGDADFTIEGWFYKTGTGQQDAFGLYETANNRRSYLLTTGDSSTIFYYNYTGSSGTSVTASFTLSLNEWVHVAITKDGTTLKIYVDGKLSGTTTGLTSGAYANTDDQFMIGSSDYSNANGSEWTGHISNLRIVKGYVLYNGDFTVPDHALEVVPGTVLLACNNPDSVTAVESALIGKGLTLTAVNDVAISSINPGLTRDFTGGTEFRGVTTFDTQGYFVPPSGTTTDRDSAGGRGVIKGGDNAISYISISSQGNSKDFGDLTVQAENTSACASSTRGLFSAGYNHPLYHKIIDYVTIATTGNATSFGSITTGESYVYGMGGCSSSTRGLFGGGFSAPSPDALSGVAAITYVTIASLGNSQSFGDLTVGVRYPSATSSPIRGIFGGGRNTPDGNINVISYVTIATTGDATNFGDLTFAPYSQASTGSSTRGMTMGGFNPAGNTAFDNIDYVTIASTGNAQDFGNLTVARGGHAATSNAVRGTFAGGNNVPAATNHIDYVTIASTGDALDFGDLTSSSGSLSALSDSHGGLS